MIPASRPACRAYNQPFTVRTRLQYIAGIMRLPSILLASCFFATGAAADEAPARLVAGYKALFTCSATFLAGRTPEQIARNDLTGIYRSYEAAMASLPAAEVDNSAKSVSVAWSDRQSAVARFREGLGCSLLPPDAAVSMPLPSIESGVVAAAEPDWPDGDRLSEPAAGADAAGSPLARVTARAFDGNSFGRGSRTSAVVIVRDGRIVAEAYAGDSGMHVPQRTWSVAKTIMAALIGIAVGEELLKPGETAALPQWSAPGDPRGAIRVEHLLHMASGLDAGPLGSRTDEVYFGGARVADAALGNPLIAPPGTHWFYANNDTLALSWLLRTRIGDDARYHAFPHEKLFRPIGMRNTTPETDWDGTFILSSQVWTTARDLARFGLLLLNDGIWRGRRILPEGWVEFMRTPAPAQPPATRTDDRPQPGYGAQVWLFGERHGLPQGTYAAMGNRGQFVVVVPSAGVVIVRRGYDPETGPFRIEQFTAAALNAVGP